MMRDESRGPDRLSTADLAEAAQRADARAETRGERVIEQRVVDDTRVVDARDADTTPLLQQDAIGELRERWTDIQAGFVDEPRHAVERADQLVAEAIKRLAESFSGERTRLEAQWDRGDDVSTEDLRQALQRYRAFFSRLLSV
jgi:hypothetical protein